MKAVMNQSILNLKMRTDISDTSNGEIEFYSYSYLFNVISKNLIVLKSFHKHAIAQKRQHTGENYADSNCVISYKKYMHLYYV